MVPFDDGQVGLVVVAARALLVVLVPLAYEVARDDEDVAVEADPQRPNLESQLAEQ